LPVGAPYQKTSVPEFRSTPTKRLAVLASNGKFVVALVVATGS
jgi:hypothetical protein